MFGNRNTPFAIYHSAFTIIIIVFACMSCGNGSNTDYSPKPKGYARIDLPKAKYTKLTGHPYEFEISNQAVVLPDSFAPNEPHWIFVAYPQYGASIQLTYRDVSNNPKKLEGAIGDAHRLAAKHQIKASGINEGLILTKSGKKAIVFELEGDVPSYFQFYTTDTTRHFLRGALYFNVAEKQDSLAPVIEYLKKDAMHLLNTLKWRK